MNTESSAAVGCLLPAHWETVPLGDIASKVTSGSRDWKPYYGRGTGVFVLSQNVRMRRLDLAEPFHVDPPAEDPARSRSKVQPDDLLINIVGAVGTVARVHEPLPEHYVCQSVALVRPALAEMSRWLELYLASPAGGQAYFREKTYGLGRPHLGFADLKAMPIPIPPMDEQRRIVERADELLATVLDGEAAVSRALSQVPAFDAAAHQSAIWNSSKSADDGGSAISDRLASERLHAWEERRDAGRAKGRYKAPLACGVELQVPVGWELLSLDEACEFVTDGDHNPPKRQPTGVPHLTAKNVVDGGLDFNDTTFIATDDFESVRQRYDPKGGDVIVTCVGTIGRVGVVPEGCVFSPDRNLAGLRPLPGIDAEYLAAVLNTPQLQTLMRDASGSTAQPHLYLADLRALPVPVPPRHIQASIVHELGSTLSASADGEAGLLRAVERASLLRASLLHEACAGTLVSPSEGGESSRALLARAASARAAAQLEARDARKKRRAVPAAE